MNRSETDEAIHNQGVGGWGGWGRVENEKRFSTNYYHLPLFAFLIHVVCVIHVVLMLILSFFFFFLYFIFFLIKSVFHSMADVYTRVSIVFFLFFDSLSFFFLLFCFFFFTRLSRVYFRFKSISSSATLPSRTSWAVENNTIA